MSSSIDERIVAMSFDNRVFEANVARTMQTLSRLEASLQSVGRTNGFANIDKAAGQVRLSGATSALDRLKAKISGIGSGATSGFSNLENASRSVRFGGITSALERIKSKLNIFGGRSGATGAFQSVQGAANGVSFAKIDKGIGGITHRFGAMQIAATTAFATVVSKATSAAGRFIKSFTIAPIAEGFKGYEKQIDATQVVMSNLGLKGTAGLKKVTDQLNILKKYAQQTVYNFSDMAKNVGTFTAAGVGLKDSTAAIKGIANASALAGGDAERAAPAMYQLSQALANNKFGLQDYTSVVNAGFGGKAFQQSLLYTAQAMGKVGKNAIKAVGPMHNLQVNGQSFREAITSRPGTKPLIDSGVLSKALATFTGDLSVAQLKAQGYSDNAAKILHEQGVAAKKAASQIKTFDQLQQALKEEVAGAYANVFKALVGDLFQAKTVFSKVHTVIENDLTIPINNFAKVVDEANKKFNFRDNLIAGFKNIYEAFVKFVKPIHDAFREIFPKQTAEGLGKLGKSFKSFTQGLIIGKEKADDLKRTFAGVFAVFHIGVTILKKVIGGIAHLFGLVGHGSGGFLKITGSVGDFLVALDKAISKGDAFGGIFASLTAVLRTPFELLKAIGRTIASLFTGDQAKKGEGLASAFHNVGIKMGPLAPIIHAVSKALSKLGNIVHRVKDFLSPVFDKALSAVSTFADKLTTAIKGLKFDQAMSALQTALTGGIFLTLKKAIGGGVGINLHFFNNIKESVVGTLNALTGSLKAMQQAIRANALLQIAVALGVLGVGVYAISKIDPKRLKSSMLAISVGLGELVGALRLLGSVGGSKAFLTLPLAASLVLLAVAVDILAVAVAAFSKLSFEGLAKGLIGVGGALLAIAAGVKAIGPRIILIGPALIPLAIGMDLLAVSVTMFANLKWEQIAKGLIGVAGSLLAIGVGVKAIGPSILLVGPGLVVAAAGLILLSGAVSSFGNMSLATLGKGLLGVAASLIVLGIAVAAIPPTIIVQAAGLVVMGIALSSIAVAVGILGHMKVGTLVKGILAMGGALVVLGIGLEAMSGTLLGSAALVGAALAFALLAPALALMGSLDMSTILKGLLAMGAVLGVIAVAGLLAAPALTAMGVALLALGLGVAAISTGIYILAKGIALLASEGQKGISVLLVAITGFVALLPTIVINFVKGLVQIIQEIAVIAPKVVDAIGTILGQIVAIIVLNAPKVARAIEALLGAFLKVVNDKAKPIIDAGIRLFLNFLSGIENNIGKVVTTVGRIVTRFLNALTSQAPKMVAAGARTLAAFLNGIASNVGKVIASAVSVGIAFLNGVTKNVDKFITAGVRAINAFLDSIANSLPSVIRHGVRVVTSFIGGIANSLPKLARAATDLIAKFLDAIGNRDNIAKIVDHGLGAVLHFIQGITEGVKKHAYLQKIINATFDLGSAIVSGIVKGLAALPAKLGHFMLSPVEGAVHKVKSLLHINSPSRVFIDIGNGIVEGMAIGVRSFAGVLDDHIIRPLANMIRQNGDGKAFGKFLSGDLLKGLSGAADVVHTETQTKVLDAFKGLKDKFKDENGKLRDQIKSDQGKLKQLLDSDKQDPKKIRTMFEKIRGEKTQLSNVKGDEKKVFAALEPWKKALEGFAADYDEVSQHLEDAQQKLADAKQARDDFAQSIADQYSELPSVADAVQKVLDDQAMTPEDQQKKAEEDAKRAAVNQAQAYEKALKTQLAALVKFKATIARLEAMGLDDVTLKKLLSDGVVDQDFADSLVQGGRTAVSAINALDTQIQDNAKGLGDDTASHLYDAGVNAAQGLVDGLTAQKTAIQNVMDQIAQGMVDYLKTALGIKSPSRVFAKLGKFTAQGLVQGLTGSTAAVANAASNIGDTAASALSDSLSKVSDTMNGEIDSSLTVTPVLDLSQVEKDAKKMGGYLDNVTPITAAASYGQASTIAGETAANQAAQAEDAANAGISVTFEQNNMSPDKLSEIEIYRQTNNQLAQLKSVLPGLTA